MLEFLGADDYSILDWVQFWATILSAVGIFVIYAWLRHLFSLRWRAHRILRFKSSRRKDYPLSIVISTSENHNPGLVKRRPLRLSNKQSNGPQYPRPTVSVWTTYAVSEITEVSSMLGYRKSFETDIAERLTHNQTGDLVLIGGRVKNIRSRQFSDHFNAHYPKLKIDRSPNGGGELKKLRIGSEEFDFIPTIDEDTGYTVSDRAILVLWENPFSAGKRRRRGILCAGFTSMGTAGAAQYLSDSLQNGSLRRMWKDKRPRGRSYRRFPQFIVVLDVYINNDRYLDVYPVKLFPITKEEPESNTEDEREPDSRRFEIHAYDAFVGHRWDADQHRQRQS